MAKAKKKRIISNMNEKIDAAYEKYYADAAESVYAQLLSMDKVEGAKDYAWARAKELSTDGDPLYANFAERLKNDMVKEK